MENNLSNLETMIANKKLIKIVIVEDDKYYNKLLTKYVETLCNEKVYPQFKFEIKTFLTAHDCIEQLEDDLDIMLLDYYLINDEEDEVLNGADVLKEVHTYSPDCKVIVISELKEAHEVVQLMKSGIYEYVDKNVNSRDRVGAVLQKAISEVQVDTY